MRKIRKIFVNCFLASIFLMSSVTVASCNSDKDSSFQNSISQSEELSSQDASDESVNSGNSEEASKAEASFTFTVKANSMHTSLQLAYIDSTSYTTVPDQANGKSENSKPLPVTLKWSIKGLTSSVKNCELKIGEKEDLSDAKTIAVQAKEIKIPNLKVRTKYYYQMTGTVNGETVTSPVKSFETTQKLPRLIDCDGVTNMRDLGGYNVENGAVKQGLIYRSGRFNESYTNTINVEVTEEGMETLKELGIKTEIDLRTTVHDYNELGGYEKLDVGPLGEDVNYYKCPMIYKSLDGSDDIHTPNRPQNYTEIQKVFEYFADESNYPLVFHCNIGTDRTGFISYLLNGMLGVSQEDLFRDYLFSNFGNIGGGRGLSRISDYVNEIDACEGDSLAEKTENFLTDTIGVKQEHIDSIKEILIEEHTYTDTVVVEGTCIQKSRIKRTCVDNDLYTYYTYGDYGDHVFDESSEESIVYCTICNEAKLGNGLPKGYTAVEYIKSSGMQYIDTDFIPDSNTRVIAKMDFQNTVSNTSQNAFSARGDKGSSEEYGFLVSEGSYVSRYGDDKYFTYLYENKPFLVDKNKNVLSIDGTVVQTHQEKEFDCGVTMTIFASNRNGSVSRYASMKLYYMEIYDNGTLVRYFVPCVRDSDGKIGLYDVVNQMFYENKGEGSFIVE